MINTENYERRIAENKFIQEHEKWPKDILSVHRNEEYGWMKPGNITTVFLDMNYSVIIKTYDSLDALQEAGWLVY